MKARAGWMGTLLTSLFFVQAVPTQPEYLISIPTDGSVIGSIDDVDYLPNGNFVVLDGQAKEIMVFSPEGALVRTIGGEGEGPEEIKGASELEVTADGQVWVLDFGNRRITRWSSDGETLGSARLDDVLGPPSGWPHELVINGAGVFLKTSQFMPGKPIRIFRISQDLEGISDTLAVFVPADDGPSCQFCAISVSPSGRVYGPVGDTSSVVSELGPRGGQVSTVRLPGIPAVRRSEVELDRLRDAMAQLPVPEGVAVPEPQFPPFKPRFGRHAIGFGPNGDTWLAPKVEEGAPTTFYRFDQDGSFISSEAVEHHLHGFKLRGSRLLGIGETEFGEPVVRVYELR